MVHGIGSIASPISPHLQTRPPSQHCGEDHLDVSPKGVAVIAIQADQVRVNHIVFVPHCQFLIRHLLHILRQSKSQVFVFALKVPFSYEVWVRL